MYTLDDAPKAPGRRSPTTPTVVPKWVHWISHIVVLAMMAAATACLIVSLFMPLYSYKTLQGGDTWSVSTAEILMTHARATKDRELSVLYASSPKVVSLFRALYPFTLLMVALDGLLVVAYVLWIIISGIALCRHARMREMLFADATLFAGAAVPYLVGVLSIAEFSIMRSIMAEVVTLGGPFPDKIEQQEGGDRVTQAFVFHMVALLPLMAILLLRCVLQRRAVRQEPAAEKPAAQALFPEKYVPYGNVLSGESQSDDSATQ